MKKIFSTPFLIGFILASVSALSSFAQNADNNDSNNRLTVEKIDQNNFADIAILQGLNKITAKTSEFEVKIGNKIEFGQLIIIPHKCWQSPPDQRPESKILLEIYENSNNTKTRIFYGWMFASSPSISSLEHPIYDVTALGCRFR